MDGTPLTANARRHKEPRDPVESRDRKEPREPAESRDRKRLLEDREQTEPALSKNKQKKISRNPRKNFSPHLKPKYVKCEQCGNPKGKKCVFSLCRGCCKKKAFREVADCPSHGLKFKTRAEKRRAEEEEQNPDPDRPQRLGLSTD